MGISHWGTLVGVHPTIPWVTCPKCLSINPNDRPEFPPGTLEGFYDTISTHGRVLVVESDVPDIYPYHPWDWCIFLHEGLVFMGNVGKITIHGSFGTWQFGGIFEFCLGREFFETEGMVYQVSWVHLSICLETGHLSFCFFYDKGGVQSDAHNMFQWGWTTTYRDVVLFEPEIYTP